MQSVRRNLKLQFQLTLFLMFPIFQKYLSSQVTTNKMVNSVVSHPCLSYFFKLLRVLFVSRMLVYSTIVWENFFNLWFSHSWKNALNICIFTHALVSHSKLQARLFENLFPPRQKGRRKIWFALSKFNQKI